MGERPSIPAEIRRAVLVEAGHRCAIPMCRYPNVEIHHIIPWEKSKTHDFENLIALCPNCHNRADSGEIDRKSLRLYKAQLSAALGRVNANAKNSETISEVALGKPGYEFDFQYPLFQEPELRPVSLYFESFGFQLLQEYRVEHHFQIPVEYGMMEIPNTTSASYECVRNDDVVLSIKYQLNQYFSGAAHGTGQTITRNYVKKPLMLLGLKHIFQAPYYRCLQLLSELCREHLLKDSKYDEKWVLQGTDPETQDFCAFSITDSGILITFDEYQVDCYAAGPQVVEIPISRVASIVHPLAKRLWAAFFSR